ncbi:MAG: 50S ribosomal protein L29 [Puniceicoccales bacterium]|jgi:ribosomal protein L29|nr:50S ribosomal protein L29 [Puniceicoccales bacterium]
MENFREKSERELGQSLKDAEKSLFDLRMKKCSSLLDKPHTMVFMQRQIARIKTFLKQKACKDCNK